MALPDRNTEYMQEQFGTTSLITDYRPAKKDTLTIDDVIAQLEDIISSDVSESNLQTVSNVVLFEIGEKQGMIKCAKMTLQLLEKLK
jgi:hypothetical protein